MYCVYCGCKLPDNSKFCSSCGKAVMQSEVKIEGTIIAERISDENPYASVVTNTPAIAESVSSQPYTQPAQNPSPTQQTQYFPNTPQPQYLRPVQTPQGVMYVPAQPVTSYIKPQEPAKFNIFTFITIGIIGTIALLCFLPWFTLDGDPYTLYKMLDYNFVLEHYGVDDFAVCAVFMYISLALMIPSLTLALVKKNRMPLVFPIITSSVITIALLVYVSVMPSYSYVLESTPVPTILFILSVANIVFPILNRRK